MQNCALEEIIDKPKMDHVKVVYLPGCQSTLSTSNSGHRRWLQAASDASNCICGHGNCVGHNVKVWNLKQEIKESLYHAYC